jgi:Ca2+-transporting ATPase
MPAKDDTSVDMGLTRAEVAHRYAEDGPNELPRSGKHGLFAIIREVLFEPMLFLLLACSGIYLALGDRAEAILLSAFVCFVVVITFVQRYRAEKALESLRDLSSPRALVIRDGEKKRIPARELVLGDIIVIEEGDRVPADAVVLQSRECMVNESILTGESVAVSKIPWDGSKLPDAPGGEKSPLLFASTVVIRGYAVGRVCAIGVKTSVGKIGKLLSLIQPKKTRLEQDIARLVTQTGILGMVVCVIATGLVFIKNGSIIPAILTGLSLAMSMLPEELPVVLMIFLALGVYRLSKRSVLTRRMPVIETLGSVTALCVDKTGTLTENSMRVASIFDGVHTMTISASTDISTSTVASHVVSIARMACDSHSSDPIDEAITTASHRIDHHRRYAYTFIGASHLDVPFCRAFEYTIDGTQGKYIVAKGAPESIITLCNGSKEDTAMLSDAVVRLASKGYRVIGVAEATCKEKTSQPTFTFAGLIAFDDPVRKEAKQSIAQCHSAGIRVVIITGDYPATARYVASNVGIPSDEIITGNQLVGKTPEQIGEIAAHVSVFARIIPEQKLSLIEALKKNGEVVGMTGDGVNDAPALKSSNVGIAMGKHGTDVARESSSLVLLDDNIASIVDAIRAGRTIYDNIVKAASFILSVHVPIAGLAIIPAVFGTPMILLPTHIALLELLIDPSCSVVFEAESEEGNIMKRKPRPVKQHLFNRRDLILRFAQGGVSLLSVLTVYFVLIWLGVSEEGVRGVAFLSLLSANIALICSTIVWGPQGTIISAWENSKFRMLVSVLVLVVTALYAVPILQTVFHMNLPSVTYLIAPVWTFLSTYIGAELIERFETNITRG